MVCVGGARIHYFCCYRFYRGGIFRRPLGLSKIRGLKIGLSSKACLRATLAWGAKALAEALGWAWAPLLLLVQLLLEMQREKIERERGECRCLSWEK